MGYYVLITGISGHNCGGLEYVFLEISSGSLELGTCLICPETVGNHKPN